MKILLKILPFVLLLAACKPTRTYLADEKASYYRFKSSDTLVADPSVSAMITPYRAKLESQMNEVVGTTPRELKHEQPIGTMDIWAAETIHSQVEKHYGQKADFTVLNYNGLRIRMMPKGAITVGKLFELMPFDNTLLLLEADSATVQKFFDYMAKRGGWPIAGATYTIKNKTTAENILIGGALLRGGRTYKLAVPDYVANGGDNCDFLKTLKREDRNVLLRNAFIEGARAQTQAGKMLDAPENGRIKVN